MHLERKEAVGGQTSKLGLTHMSLEGDTAFDQSLNPCWCCGQRQHPREIFGSTVEAAVCVGEVSTAWRTTTTMSR